MFKGLFKFLTSSPKALLYIALGLILILGALSKLGIFQAFLNVILVLIGILLVYQGIAKTDLLKKIKKS